jgi:feruloyl esterase
MPHAAITSAQTVAAGTFSPANRGANAKPVMDLPAFCRVTATLTPTSDSQIGVEVWMPASGWNGKLQSIGNHELGGVIFYGDMGAELKRNFAVASTDTGHTETADASWASGHPEKVVDFGWRAVHEMTVTAKAVVAAFYGANARYSYFNGCSSGGREALKEAQKFPDDYDGIISGSAMKLLDAFAPGTHLGSTGDDEGRHRRGLLPSAGQISVGDECGAGPMSRSKQRDPG